MEAARRLIQRGHRVILFEKEKHLGGSLLPAGANALKGDVKRFTDWSVRMTEHLDGRTCVLVPRRHGTMSLPRNRMPLSLP
jgi:NADPH-dependent 2,4-dienoyl-CoA reductase/sulfur reductase-like enzyme